MASPSGLEVEASRLLYRNAGVSPIGGVRFCGFVRDGGGVGENPMRVLGSYAVVYMLYGRAWYTDARGTRASLQPGDLILLFPDVPHAYGPAAGERWDEFYIVFDGPVFDAWRAGGVISPERPLHHVQPIRYWLRRLVTAAGRGNGGDAARSVAEVVALQGLLADVIRSAAPDPDPAGEAWLTRARTLLSSGSSDHAAARALGMTYETFRKRFARLAGTSPARFRSAQVIERACEMLRAPAVSLRDVADRLGFCDEFHFSRRFKQHVGVPPSEFRRRLPR